ncbi:MAG TPA: glycosyltransferase family 2 protein [Candidatus Paceibacterota bacterium]|nr:glycosyltransferase family 2 protein [Candidatus Paceibacterota bacterium]
MSREQPYDLAVAYRICPFVSRAKPPIHADSKYHLAKLCLRSFKDSLGTLRVKIWAILDNCPTEYEELFRSLWNEEDLVLLRFPGLGNAGTFAKQIEILTGQNDAELVYVAEDDYVYQPGRFHLITDLMRKNSDVDFCTPYDHPDYYAHPFHDHKMRIKVEQGQVWKTQNGTTCSFITRKAVLQETAPTLLSYARKNTDAGIWLSLTKEHVLNPIDLLTTPFISKFRGWSLVCAWFFNWRQLLFGRKYTLWVPVPSLATHMVAGLLAPNVDWEPEFERASAGTSQLRR